MRTRNFPTLVCLLVALSAPQAVAQSNPPAPANEAGVVDQSVAAAFKSVIGAQVAAFQRDDWTEAFSYAAPSIQSYFGDPVGFRRMVLSGYRAVAEPSVFEFQDATVLNGRPAQVVYVVGPDGKAYRAVYFMQQQPNGSWKISGVTLLPLEGTTT
jgi:hypothetical protein